MHRHWVPSGTPKSIKSPKIDTCALRGPLCRPWVSLDEPNGDPGSQNDQKGINNGAQTTHLDTIVAISMATKVETGGRGGALRYPPPPRRGTGRAKTALALSPGSCLTLQVLKAQGGPPLPPAPPKSDPKVHQKVIKNRIKKTSDF